MSPSTHPTNVDPADFAETAFSGWFDAHNHLHDPRLGGDYGSLVATQRAVGISGCVVNATCEDEWSLVATLAREFPDFILPSFGIHPWKSHTATPGWQHRLLGLLETFPHAGIGECGIDSWIDSPPMDIQKPVFLEHLRLARETGRTPTIHCLKAWGVLFDCLDRENPPARFLMHSYGGSIETARSLLPAGAYFSFSGYFLHERKRNILGVFRELQPDRILLETDAPDMIAPDTHITHRLPNGSNHPANLPATGIALAAELGMNPTMLAKLVGTNARTCFCGG
jgi:TatD DNase family protein